MTAEFTGQEVRSMSGRLEARVVVDPSSGPRSSDGHEPGLDALAAVEHGFEAVAAHLEAASLEAIALDAASDTVSGATTAAPPGPSIPPGAPAIDDGELNEDLAVDFRNVESVLQDETAGLAPTPAGAAVQSGQPAPAAVAPIDESIHAVSPAPAVMPDAQAAPTGGASGTNKGEATDPIPPAAPVTAERVSVAAGAVTTAAPSTGGQTASVESPATASRPPTVSVSRNGSPIVAVLSWTNVPLRMLPAKARTLVSFIAATLLLWVPVVWLTPRELVASQHDVSVPHAEEAGAHTDDGHGGGHGDDHAAPPAKKQDAHADHSDHVGGH
jgi:hypothetical protein